MGSRQSSIRHSATACSHCNPRQTISMWYCEQVPWQNNIDFEWLYAEQINITEHENFTSPIALTSDCGCTMNEHSNVVVLVFTITNDEHDKYIVIMFLPLMPY